MQYQCDIIKMLSLKLFLLPVYFSSLSHCSITAISQITLEEWAALNASVDGRLYLGRPKAFPCYTSYGGVADPVNAMACAEIESQKTNASYIGDQFGGFFQVCTSPRLFEGISLSMGRRVIGAFVKQ